MNKNKINSEKDTSEYFDDCDICKTMKEAEQNGKSLSVEELETVFAKQNLKNKTSLSLRDKLNK